MVLEKQTGVCEVAVGLRVLEVVLLGPGLIQI